MIMSWTAKTLIGSVAVIGRVSVFVVCVYVWGLSVGGVGIRLNKHNIIASNSKL